MVHGEMCDSVFSHLCDSFLPTVFIIAIEDSLVFIVHSDWLNPATTKVLKNRVVKFDKSSPLRNGSHPKKELKEEGRE